MPGLEEFVGEFLKDRLSEMEVVKNSLKQKDLETIKRMAHKWKGYSEPYGFGQLGVLAKDLENSAAKGNFQDCQNQLSSICEYLDQKAKAIDF